MHLQREMLVKLTTGLYFENKSVKNGSIYMQEVATHRFPLNLIIIAMFTQNQFFTNWRQKLPFKSGRKLRGGAAKVELREVRRRQTTRSAIEWAIRSTEQKMIKNE